MPNPPDVRSMRYWGIPQLPCVTRIDGVRPPPSGEMASRGVGVGRQALTVESGRNAAIVTLRGALFDT